MVESFETFDFSHKMEQSTQKRKGRLYNVLEAQLLFDEIPSDNGETTDEESSEDDDFNDPTFAPPLFEELIPEEQPFQIQESREADDKMEGSVDSTPIIITKANKVEVNRHWRKKDEPMVIDPFLGPEGM